MPFLTLTEIQRLGFGSVGKNVRISNRASIYGADHISIGDHTRIDDFVVLSAGKGGICIGKHVHIAVFCSLIGAGSIELGDYANLSSRVSIYSSTDDFSGESMTNPTVEDQLKNVTHAPVTIGRHSIVGSGSVILPGVIVEDCVSVGALSLVKERCESHAVYGGIPARMLKARSRRILDLESEIGDHSNSPEG